MINFYFNEDSFQVGSTLTGSCLWTPDKPSNQKLLRLTIGWRTEGRGDVEQQTLYHTEIRPSERTHFKCNIPFSAPVSYDGQLLRIIWEIAVTRIKFLGLRHVIQSQEIRVIPQQKR